MRDAEQIITKHALDTLQTRLPSVSVSLFPFTAKILTLSLSLSLTLSLALLSFISFAPLTVLFISGPPACLFCVFMLNKLAVLTESKIVGNHPQARHVDTP